MGINKLQGVPWHIESLKKNDERRHKNWCTHYNKGKCDLYERKCSGSKNCDNYVDNESHERNKSINKGNYISYNYYDKKYMQGRFTLEYEDGSRQHFVIRKDIDINAPIMEYVLKTKCKDEFVFNNEKIKVVMKKIRYSQEATKMQNYYYNNRLLCNKNLDEEYVNNTNVDNLKFKIKFIDDGKVIHYVAGKSIRWDDPLLKKIIEMKSGSKFTYKSIKLLLVSKYMHEKDAKK